LVIYLRKVVESYRAEFVSSNEGNTQSYVQVGKSFVYLSLIMDAFSRKIVGWGLQPTLEAKDLVDALKMAFETCKKKTKFKILIVVFNIVRGLTWN
jgi:transposase InsO family protein